MDNLEDNPLKKYTDIPKHLKVNPVLVFVEMYFNIKCQPFLIKFFNYIHLIIYLNSFNYL